MTRRNTPRVGVYPLVTGLFRGLTSDRPRRWRERECIHMGIKSVSSKASAATTTKNKGVKATEEKKNKSAGKGGDNPKPAEAKGKGKPPVKAETTKPAKEEKPAYVPTYKAGIKVWSVAVTSPSDPTLGVFPLTVIVPPEKAGGRYLCDDGNIEVESVADERDMFPHTPEGKANAARWLIAANRGVKGVTLWNDYVSGMTVGFLGLVSAKLDDKAETLVKGLHKDAVASLAKVMGWRAGESAVVAGKRFLATGKGEKVYTETVKGKENESKARAKVDAFLTSWGTGENLDRYLATQNASEADKVWAEVRASVLGKKTPQAEPVKKKTVKRAA